MSAEQHFLGVVREFVDVTKNGEGEIEVMIEDSTSSGRCITILADHMEFGRQVGSRGSLAKSWQEVCKAFLRLHKERVWFGVRKIGTIDGSGFKVRKKPSDENFAQQPRFRKFVHDLLWLVSPDSNFDLRNFAKQSRLVIVMDYVVTDEEHRNALQDGIEKILYIYGMMMGRDIKTSFR